MSTSRRAPIVTDRSTSIVTMATSVKRELYDAFEQLAHADGMTKSQKMRELIEREVAMCIPI